MTMAWASFSGPLILLGRYPEIILAVGCFFLIRSLSHKGQLPVNWPIFGMLPSLVLNLHRLHDWYTDVLSKSRHTFVFHGPWFSRMQILLTCDPANVSHITKTNFSNYPKGSDFAEIFDIFGDGITNVDSDPWRNQRTMAHSLIHGPKFRAAVARTCLEKVERGIIPVLEHMAYQGKIVDLQDVFQRLMFDSMCILIFGTDPGSLSVDFPGIPFADAMDDVEQAILFRYIMPRCCWKLLRWLKMGKEKKLGKAWKTLDESLAYYISMRTEEISKHKERVEEEEEEDEDGHEEGGDLLTFYLKNSLKDGPAGSENPTFLRDTSLNLMLAGRDTNATGLTWFFYLLSKNPLVERKIMEELLQSDSTEMEDECPKKLKVFVADELSKFVYLHAALYESLRLFAPVPLIHRGVSQPDVLPSGEHVRPGMKVVYTPYAMGRMEGLWGEDCLEFKPERWISKHGALKFEHSYKFLVFSAGLRNCLGKDLAFTQMKAVAAAMLYNFHVDVIGAHHVSSKVSVVLPMKDGLMARIRHRSG